MNRCRPLPVQSYHSTFASESLHELSPAIRARDRRKIQALLRQVKHIPRGSHRRSSRAICALALCALGKPRLRMEKRTAEWLDKDKINRDYHERQFREPYRSTIAFCNWLEAEGLVSPESELRILDL